MMLARGWGAQHHRGGGGERECYGRLRGDIRRRMMALLGFQRSEMECGGGDLFKYSRRKRSRLELRSGVKVPMGGGTGEMEVVDGSSSTADGIDGECSKVCVDCQTTKTPLWRTGPIGPKTLCNACGIRYMKLRRKGLAQRSMIKSKNGNKGSDNIAKSSTSTSMSPEEVQMLKQKQKRKQEVLWSLLQKSREFASTCGKEEAEAAVLLMALSTGLFLHS